MPASRLSLTGILVLSLALGGCDRGADGDGQESAASSWQSGLPGEIDRSQAGTLMPAVNLTDPSGRELNMGALQGRPVLVNLWATWCAPCIKEMPLLDELAADYGEDLHVLTVSQDLQGADKVEPFFAERNFAHLEPWLDPANALMADLGAATLPTTILYDTLGQEVWRVTGDYDWSSAEARGAIDEALGGLPPVP